MEADVLAPAIAIALSPFPVVPSILMLFTDRPRTTSSAFLAGWALGVLAGLLAFMVLGSVIELYEGTPTWVAWGKVVLGLLLVALGVRQWLTRGSDPDEPSWMSNLRQATPRAAARLGVMLSAANPKILVLAAAAGISLAGAGLSPATTALSAAVFTVVASVTVSLPLVAFLIGGQRIMAPLTTAKDWLVKHNAAIVAAVLVIIGVVVLVQGWMAR